MKKKILGILAMGCMALSSVAKADVVISDWMTAGDNMVILDQNTGLSWLKLTATDGMTYDDVAAQLDTTFAGWYLASNDQVTSIMETMFPGIDIQVGMIDNRMNAAGNDKLLLNTQVNYFNSVFGNGVSNRADQNGTYYDENGLLRSAGVYLNESGVYTALRGMENNTTASCSNVVLPGFHSGNGANGIWLVDQGGVSYTSSTCDAGQTEYVGPGVTVLSNEGGTVGTSSNVSAPLALGGLAMLGLAGFVRRKN